MENNLRAEQPSNLQRNRQYTSLKQRQEFHVYPEGEKNKHLPPGVKCGCTPVIVDAEYCVVTVHSAIASDLTVFQLGMAMENDSLRREVEHLRDFVHTMKKRYVAMYCSVAVLSLGLIFILMYILATWQTSGNRPMQRPGAAKETIEVKSSKPPRLQ